VLETSINNKKYFLCNVYRAPAGQNDESHRDLIENFNNRLEELMNELNMPHYNTLFFLDSNINLLKLSNSQLAAEYLDTCHANGYIIANLKATRICNNSYSLIDQILTTNIEQNCISGSIVCDISDHFPIFYSFDYTKPKNVDACKSYRPISLENMTLFRDALRNLSWNHVTLEQDVNRALEQFLDTFLTLFDLYFPVKTKKLNRDFDSLNEFMTRGLLVSRRRKNLLYKKQLISPTPNNVNLFRTYRNIYNSLIRRSKRLYYETNLKKFRTQPKKIWNILKKAIRSGGPPSEFHSITSNNQNLVNDSDIASALNKHFSNVGTEILNSIVPTNVDPLSFIPDNPNIPEFVMNNIGPIH
jgi:hypothetical protein